MANERPGFGKRFQIITISIAIVALVFPVLHLIGVFPHGGGGDGEPGARRYDRVTFFNVSDEPATNVHVKLYTDTAGTNMWWDCPTDGYLLGDVAAGESVTWVFNHEENDGVARVTCEMEYEDPTMATTTIVVATCEITAYPNYAFNAATFWFGHPHAAGGMPTPERELCGQAVMSDTSSSGPTPYVLPHTQSQQAPKNP